MIHLQKLQSTEVLNKMYYNYTFNLFPSVVQITDKDDNILFIDDCLYPMSIITGDTPSANFSTTDFLSNNLFVTKKNETVGEYLNKNAISQNTYEKVNLSKYFELTPTGYYKVKDEYISGNKRFFDFALCDNIPHFGTPISTAIDYMWTNSAKPNTLLRQPAGYMDSLMPLFINCTMPNYMRPESDIIIMFGVPDSGEHGKTLMHSALRYFHPELLNCEYVDQTRKQMFVKFTYYKNSMSSPYASPKDYTWTCINGYPDTMYTENSGSYANYLENGYRDNAISMYGFQKIVHYQVYADGNGREVTQYEGDIDLTEYVKHFNDPTHLNFL